MIEIKQETLAAMQSHIEQLYWEKSELRRELAKLRDENLNLKAELEKPKIIKHIHIGLGVKGNNETLAG